MRLLGIFLGLAVLLLIPFLLWAEAFEFGEAGAVGWLRAHGDRAWAAGVALLLADLVLPVPGTAVMAALGLVYGSVLGGIISAAGSFLSGALAYGLCRALGRGAAVWLVGERDLRRGEELFQRIGGWLVVVSRWLPLFPEVIACLAGLVRMPARMYLLALACGSLPLGFTYAAVGAAGVDRPVLALVLSAGMPPLVWWLIQRWMGGHGRDGNGEKSSSPATTRD